LISNLIELIDKILLFDDGSIGGLFLLVKGYYGTEKQELVMRLVKEGGSAAALLRNQPIFWSSHPTRGHL
jgi:hypothetical protein